MSINVLFQPDSPLSLSLFQEIYKDRKKFSKQVFEVASSDLVNMGITVVSYTLKDIRDDEVRGRGNRNIFEFLSKEVSRRLACREQ